MQRMIEKNQGKVRLFLLCFVGIFLLNAAPVQEVVAQTYALNNPALYGSSSDSAVDVSGAKSLIKGAIEVTNLIIILLTAVCVVFFIIGLIQYVFRKNGDEVASKGRAYMIYSVVAFAVLTALFGLANFLANLVPDIEGENSNANYNIPGIDPEMGTGQ